MEARAGSPGDRSARRLEVAALLLITAAAAILRVPGLPSRGQWDSDQGGQMLALRAFVHDGVVPLLGPPASVGGFHHGALYYWLLAPAAAIGGGNDPVPVLAFFAIVGIAGVLAAWWAGRSMAGPVAGLIAASVVAVSAPAVQASTWLWNPNLVGPAALVAIAAAWTAWRSRDPRWWIVSAAALAVAGQCHILAWLLGVPLAALYLAAIRGAPPGETRARTVRWGAAGAAVIVASFLPMLAYDATHGFAEARGVLSFLTSGSAGVTLDPASRIAVVAIRILAWPIAGLLTSVPIPAVLAAVGVALGLTWMSLRPDHRESAAARWMLGSLAFAAIALGIGVPSLAQVTALPVDQYHAAFDPIVVLAAAVALAALLRSGRVPAIGASLALVAIVGWNLAHEPPAPSPDGGWPAAAAAAKRLEADTAGVPYALVSLPPFKPSDAYLFPLTSDNHVPSAGAAPQLIVVLCDDLFVRSCGSAAMNLARARSAAPVAIDRFDPAPGRHLSVFRIVER